jgi:hypothetical protein
MASLKAGPMREHDFTTLFKLEHMLKDVRHCLEESLAAGVPFPAAAQAREVLAAGIGRGRGDDDFAALIEVLEGAAGHTVVRRPENPAICEGLWKSRRSVLGSWEVPRPVPE